jgi:tetratricopeptide (TPR) repeat protein
MVALKRFDDAKAEANSLMNWFDHSDNAYDNLMASIYLRNIMGIMAYETEAFHTAEQHWQEAYQQSSMVGPPDLIASLGNNLGMVYINLGEYDAAEEILSDALSKFDQLGDVSRWANCMDNLVDLYEKMGDLDAARFTLRTAIGRLEPEATLAHSQKMLQKMQTRLENFPKS